MTAWGKYHPVMILKLHMLLFAQGERGDPGPAGCLVDRGTSCPHVTPSVPTPCRPRGGILPLTDQRISGCPRILWSELRPRLLRGPRASWCKVVSMFKNSSSQMVQVQNVLYNAFERMNHFHCH